MPTCYRWHRLFVKMRFSLVFPIFCIPIGFCQCIGFGFRFGCFCILAVTGCRCRCCFRLGFIQIGYPSINSNDESIDIVSGNGVFLIRRYHDISAVASFLYIPLNKGRFAAYNKHEAAPHSDSAMVHRSFPFETEKTDTDQDVRFFSLIPSIKKQKLRVWMERNNPPELQCKTGNKPDRLHT